MDLGEALITITSASTTDFDNNEFMKILSNADSKFNVDVVDEHGMTALMHTAYHGHVQACKELLSRGADVNYNKHKDGYTALMFAALAGKREIVEMLLLGGAKTGTRNNLGKTASTMAAFVGQHTCVQVITNFFPLSELDEYTVTTSTSGPRLPPTLATPLHSLLTSINIHPIKILLGLAESSYLDDYRAVKSVLSSLDLRMVRSEQEQMSLKLHYISYLMGLAHHSGVEATIRRVLTFDENGKAVHMDLLLRQCLKEFPHLHLSFLKPMVASLAKTPPGDDPTSYSLIVSLILGDRGAVASEDSCSTCGISPPLHSPPPSSSPPVKENGNTLKKCSRCKKAWYCSVQCQQLAWTKGNHKKLCKQWTRSSPSS